MPKRFLKSVKYAGVGAQHALRTQRNIRIHLAIAILVFIGAGWLGSSPIEMAVILLAIFFVITAELFNTAIEETIDLVKPYQHPLAALIKNVSAAAVLLAAVGALIVGVLVLVPKIIL
ncbi:MAG: diacylglycerol kinase family protein [bacterium]